jgi:monoterpene epsilon-lactone hydrolase
MQPETRTEQRNVVGADVRHSLSDKDREAVAAMRKEVAPFKGKMSDPSARPPFDEVMEHTPDARGVTYEKKSVGGVPGISCTPEGTRPGAVILYLHGGAYVLGSANAYRHFAGQIAARAKAAVFIAEYRLAPMPFTLQPCAWQRVAVSSGNCSS